MVGDSPLEHLRVPVEGGTLHVARCGAGSPLLLLHGWPEAGFTWHRVMARLAGQFTLIAPDLRGFGKSDKPAGPFGLPEQVGDMAALIERLVPGPVGVVAHDVGGSVAQGLARSRPDLLAGLFLFNFVYPGIGDRFNAPGHLPKVWHTYFNQSDLAPRLLRASPDGIRLYVTHWLENWAHREHAFDPATVDLFVSNMEQPGNLEGGFTWYRTVAEQRAREAGSAPPPPITVPTCVRWTENDAALPFAWSDRVAEFFTDLDFAPFPGAGHFPHHEDPDRAAAEVAGFFGRLLRRGQSA